MASSHTTEKQDPAAVLRLLRASEGELLELSESLDEPIRPDEYRLAILALGQRARTLFRGFIGLQDTAAPAAGRALLRPMIEINTLIRFLHKNLNSILSYGRPRGTATSFRSSRNTRRSTPSVGTWRRSMRTSWRRSASGSAMHASKRWPPEWWVWARRVLCCPIWQSNS
jgi:hypothetical protein